MRSLYATTALRSVQEIVSAKWIAHNSDSEMDRERALQLLKGGRDSIQRWNRWRENHTELPNLSHADFSHIDLSDANLSGVNLEKSRFIRAQLIGAQLQRSNLKGANFREANLNLADLNGAILLDANCRRTNLCAADLRNSILKAVIFEGAECDSETKWPRNFDPRAVGLVPWPEE